MYFEMLRVVFEWLVFRVEESIVRESAAVLERIAAARTALSGSSWSKFQSVKERGMGLQPGFDIRNSILNIIKYNIFSALFELYNYLVLFFRKRGLGK